jgi:hypothetical protein
MRTQQRRTNATGCKIARATVGKSMRLVLGYTSVLLAWQGIDLHTLLEEHEADVWMYTSQERHRVPSRESNVGERMNERLRKQANTFVAFQ